MELGIAPVAGHCEPSNGQVIDALYLTALCTVIFRPIAIVAFVIMRSKQVR